MLPCHCWGCQELARRSVRVFAAFLCLLSLFSFSGISARGINTKEYKQQATFWTMFSGVPILKEFLGYTAGLVCPESDDGYHHASSYEVDRESGYYNCICDVCGWPFLAYETDLQQAYETQVSELPATGVTSSGGLLFNPLDYLDYVRFQFGGTQSYHTEELSVYDLPYIESKWSYSFVQGNNPHIFLILSALLVLVLRLTHLYALI